MKGPKNALLTLNDLQTLPPAITFLKIPAHLTLQISSRQLLELFVPSDEPQTPVNSRSDWEEVLEEEEDAISIKKGLIHVHELVLSNCRNLCWPDLAKFMPLLSNLRQLDISRCGGLKEGSLDLPHCERLDASYTCFSQLSIYAPNLSYLRLAHCTDSVYTTVIERCVS